MSCMEARPKPGPAGHEPDLASIVLGSVRPHGRTTGLPEAVPTWLERHDSSRFDARSVAILALVVAVLAGIVGWATGLDATEPITQSPRAAGTSRSESDRPSTTQRDAAGAPAAGSDAEAAAAPVLVDGIDLSPGRIVAGRAATGGGLVTVSVRNGGSRPAVAGAQVLVLMDGDVIGTERLGALEPGASARIELPVGWCPAGAVSLVAVVDAGSALREANERDNSLTRSTAFGC